MSVSGNPLEYLAAFWGGVILSFTPCLYPLMPITVSYIGIKADSSKFKGLALSSVYVSGIAVIYSVLGTVASLTGKFFGRVTTHPLTHIFVGGVVILFGLSMLDIFVIPIPNLVKLPPFKKQGFLSTFFLGLASGLIVSPCITPALGAILAYVATKQNILYGATLLFSFAYGMGLVLIIVGTFSTILISLPKSGRWMMYIKRLCALVLVGMGIYFIATGIGRMYLFPQYLHAKESYLAPDFKLPALDENTITLSNYKNKQPVILFFWTTWCPFCRKELKVLNNMYPELLKNGFEVLAINVGEYIYKVDSFAKSYPLTYKVLLDKDATVAETYKILGVPTYILIDKQGNIRFKVNSFPKEEYKDLISQ